MCYRSRYRRSMFYMLLYISYISYEVHHSAYVFYISRVSWICVFHNITCGVSVVVKCSLFKSWGLWFDSLSPSVCSISLYPLFLAWLQERPRHLSPVLGRGYASSNTVWGRGLIWLRPIICDSDICPGRSSCFPAVPGTPAPFPGRVFSFSNLYRS